MIRTRIIPCRLPRAVCDSLNAGSGSVYTGVMIWHWRTYRRKGHWLSEPAAYRWSDRRGTAALHAHSIDAAQQGFYTACATTRAVRKAGSAAVQFPYRRKRFRTTIWKNTGVRRRGDALVLSIGRGRPPIRIPLPEDLRDAVRFLEVRLVYDKRSRCHTWHIVQENGKAPKPAPGDHLVAVDLGEVHPAVVGDEREATVVTCRERRAESQGHARRLANIDRALSRKKEGSRRYRRLIRAKVRIAAKHQRVMRDLEHKISRAIVTSAVELKAGTIIIGDVRDAADGVDLGKVANQKISRWNHGKIRRYVTYKAEAEGIAVQLADEAYTTQTCPSCQARHKPKGRRYSCSACGLQAHRDVVGQINILSRYKHGEPGKIPPPVVVKYRMPHNLRLMRRCPDTGQALALVARSPLREAAGL
jgi:putative transposase